MSLQELGRLQIFKLCLHHNHDECCMLWCWGWLWYGGCYCWCWQRSWMQWSNQAKSNQWDCVDKWEVAMCEGCFEEETIPTDRSQTLSHKSLPSSLMSSLEYTLWHIHISDTGTHIQDTDTDINRHKLSVLFPVWLSVTFSKVYSLAHTETQAHINTHPNTQAWVYIIETTIDQVWFSVSLSAMKRWRKT